MSYGRPATGMHQWTLDENAAAPFFRQAVELGITFWDTANVYQGGSSEEFVGRAIRAVLAARRHRARHQGLREDARRRGRPPLEHAEPPEGTGTTHLEPVEPSPGMRIGDPEDLGGTTRGEVELGDLDASVSW